MSAKQNKNLKWNIIKQDILILENYIVKKVYKYSSNLELFSWKIKNDLCIKTLGKENLY